MYPHLDVLALNFLNPKLSIDLVVRSRFTLLHTFEYVKFILRKECNSIAQSFKARGTTCYFRRVC